MIKPRKSQKFQHFFAWVLVFICAVSILAVVPLARTIQDIVSSTLDRTAFGYLVLLSAGLAFAGAMYLLYFKLRIRKFTNFLWIFLVTAAYITFTLQLWDDPEEAVHFLEYGLLGFFLFRALRFRVHDKTIYLAAFLAGSLVGIFDEIFQWAVPGRYWDLRDVGLNTLSSGLFQLGLWQGIRPHLPSPTVSKKSITRVSILLAVNIILLGLCLTNTPALVKVYSRVIPALSYLRNEEAMHEFKYKHSDKDIGVFYSRLTLEDISETDRQKSDEYSRILREWKNKSYDDYLRHFPASVHPFLYEIRVHIFRRDKRFERALQAKNEEVRRENFFIAYKENIILEKYFTGTLMKSPFYWTDDKKTLAGSSIEKTGYYKSPVSAGLFPSLKAWALWTIISALLVIIICANLILKRRFW